MILRSIALSSVLLSTLACARQEPTPPAPATVPATAPVVAAEPLKDDAMDFEPWARLTATEIEHLTGHTFTKPPPVRIVSEDDLAESLSKPMREAMIRAGANKRPDGSPMSDLEITVRTRSQAYRVASRTLGLYDHAQKAILLIPSNAERLGKKRAWSPETVRRVVRLALAHELVHALQDQAADLSQRLDTLTGEPEKCLLAISEGHAVVVTDALAETLGWQTANLVLGGLVTGIEDAPPGTAPGAQPPPAIDTHGAPSAAVYVAGTRFIRFHAKGDHAAAWAILLAPPAAWADVQDPARWQPARPAATPAKP